VELSNLEELELLMSVLERNGLHPRCREEYIVVGGERKGRIIRDIFMSDEQIHLARRFVSSFIYETDATFNTNTLRLLLSVMVGIDNPKALFSLQ
jgi:hypothetical protein